MKISKLNIESYRHLQNLNFDFTYQTGERKGQPLDKICFIGQSATGKTGLLELIYEQFSFINNLFVTNNNQYNDLIGIKSINGKIKFEAHKSTLELNKKEFKLNGNTYYNRPPQTGTLNLSGELFKNPDDKKKIFYFKANIISENNLELFSKNPIDLIEKNNNQLKDLAHYFRHVHNNEFIFNSEVDPRIWLTVLSEILDYRKKSTQKISELLHNLDINKFPLEYQKWQNENPNGLAFFAKEFNPILEKLNLEVDLVNTEYSIPIKNRRTQEIIPIQDISTGTKGLLLSFLPLFKLDTTDSIILIDEPERSLYPDMQMDLMDHYQNLAPKAQFVVATHSPFIAASFEADERFILYFDEEGKVAVRRGTSPIGDDPNDILKNDFGINYYNKHGEEAYQKYLNLKEEIANETDPQKKKYLLLETVKLGDTYNF
ncbi:ATP-binding protein [Flavobacterium crassostreae]|uniref:Endonuclease GajA/Old nuclease/RecF-like AAA domain-containing protein n=1 Tax=Flavobacterium crassostreae TaxID=1763534 RepID=A0A1B9E3X2_9FLAO|nr:ATP-binding protein [Flavobacterium crassostreae]OCB76636.1 hypothetical protein LPBF_06805 [Flavobacterium crassostreae]